MKIDKMRLTKNGYIAEYKYRLTNANILHSILYEITLTGKLAVPRVGNSEEGTFKAGDMEYIYKIEPIEMKGRGIIWNIAFTENKSNSINNMPTGNAKDNYIKILDTMYQIIKEFIKDKKSKIYWTIQHG